MAKNRPNQRRSAEEQEFLLAYDASQLPHPSVTVDVALVTTDEHRLRALLIRRSEHPDRGKWSLPGGFVGVGESLEAAAARVLRTKAGASGIFLEQLYTFGRPDRDPRTRVISVAHYALAPATALKVSPDDPDVRLAALEVSWPGERGGPARAVDDQGKPLPLAFDHADMLGLVVQRLRGKLDYADIGFELLPKTFPLRQLQTIHEAILGQRLNKDSFRRRMLATGLIAATGELEAETDHRPAELYRFKRPARRRGDRHDTRRAGIAPGRRNVR